MNYFIIPGLRERPVYKAIYKDRDSIMQIICNYFDVNIMQLRVRNRERDIVMVRQISFYFLYERCNMSYQEIANYFAPSVSDHTTTLHGVKQIRGQLYSKYDNIIKEHIKKIGL